MAFNYIGNIKQEPDVEFNGNHFDADEAEDVLNDPNISHSSFEEPPIKCRSGKGMR